MVLSWQDLGVLMGAGQLLERLNGSAAAKEGSPEAIRQGVARDLIFVTNFPANDARRKKEDRSHHLGDPAQHGGSG